MEPAPTEAVCGCQHAFIIKEDAARFPPVEVLKPIYHQRVGKKTMWCHQITQDGRMATHVAAQQGLAFDSSDEIWEFLGKPTRCLGRYRGNAKSLVSDKIVCSGALSKASHDDTCTPETCLWIKNGLDCPKPKWAVAKPKTAT